MTRRWTARDLELLHDLYRVRTMTKAQVEAKYFARTRAYTYRRMRMLKEADVVQTESRYAEVNGEWKKAAHYRITEAGIRLLVKAGLLNEGETRARDLELSEPQRQYILDANELHVRMPERKYLDSRAIKRRYELNRGNLTVGGFETERGDYMVYVLQTDVQERTLVKIVREIGLIARRLCGVLVYGKSGEAQTAFGRMVEKLGLVTGGVPVHVLPFSARGIAITERLILGDGLGELLAPYGTLAAAQGRYGIRYGMRNPAWEKGKYVIEYLTSDILTTETGLRDYQPDVYREAGRDVLLFCWPEEAERLRERVKLMPYMEVVPVPWPPDHEPEGSRSGVPP